MTATPQDIGWGAYDKFEGPFFQGHIPYAMPVQPSFEDKVLRVFSATEGGHYDAINMYDRCIVSVGLIQWCEAEYLVSRVLGRCLELDAMMFDNFRVKFPVAIDFKKNAQGLYRFYVKGMEVSSEAMMRSLFLGTPVTGFKDTWTPETKIYAKTVAAWFANIWDYPLFRTVQAEFTKQKLPGFVLPQAKAILFDDQSADKQFSWPGALRAAFYSFAGNLPVVANKSIQKAASAAGWADADPKEQFRIALQAMTFGPGIGIYPKRYEAIAPVLNTVFGTDAPKTADELKAWGPPPEDMNHGYSQEELDALSRATKLSESVMMGTGEGLDAISQVEGS